MDSSGRLSLNPNKHLKTQFVSILNGCSMLEALNYSYFHQFSLLQYSYDAALTALASMEESGTSFKKNDDVAIKNWSAYMVTTAVDFFFIVQPIIISPTVLADWTSINAILLAIVLVFCFRSRRYGSSVSLEWVQPIRTYISSYRVTVMLVTCFCILSVDIKIFPRRYAKTETYGTSMMDLGVGAYVLANSLVSRQARGILRTSLRNELQSTSPFFF